MLLPILALLAGCAVPVAAGLDEGDANRAVVALEASGIGARKEPDPVLEGRFRVTVAEADASPALVALAQEGLPRPRSPGLLEAIGKGSLVPGAAAEHAQVAAGIAGDLERTLSSIDGVLVAHVNLNMPTPSPLRESHDKATASVFLAYRAEATPLAELQVKRIVAAGVPRLAPEDVVVVAVARPRAAQARAELAHVGPLAVARGSAAALRAVLAALVALVGALAAAVLALYMKLARLRVAQEEPRP